jgi:hypothetical protein
VGLVREIQGRCEPIEKRNLRRLDACFGFVDGKPCATVRFGDCDQTAGAWRPLHFAVIADHFGWIAVAFEGPCGDDLSAGLLDGAEIEKGLGYGEAGLFLEFTLRGFEGLLVFEVFALGDGPCSEIFFREEGAAGVNEEDLHAVRPAAVHQQTCTAFWHER